VEGRTGTCGHRPGLDDGHGAERAEGRGQVSDGSAWQSEPPIVPSCARSGRDDPFRVVQDREVLAAPRGQQLRVPDQGADPQLIALDRDPGQPGSR